MTLYLFILGLMFGSFITAFVWRLHKNQDFVHGRSMCPHCQHQLDVLDLIPVISWVILRGRCRYCKQPISWHYPAIEIITAASFAMSYTYWPRLLEGVNEWMVFALWLLSVVFFISLGVYDIKWMQLPDNIMWPLVLVSMVALSVIASIDDSGAVQNALIGVALSFGFFYLLALISNGKWIGGGDVKFGLVIGLWLGAIKSVVALLLAFYGAALFVLPLLLFNKINRKTPIPFGPFLITGTFIAMLSGHEIIEWYKSLFFI